MLDPDFVKEIKKVMKPKEGFIDALKRLKYIEKL